MRSFTREIVNDLLSVWGDTRLIVLVAQTAAIYAAVLIPFKVGIPLIPGFAELRPANALPIVASLLFGPVAAWGAGLGNLIGDCFGTLGPASLFGFLGNFCYGYVPYLLWARLGPLSSRRAPDLRSWRQGVKFVVVCLVASLVCALVIAWGVDLLGLVPFEILAIAIFVNNFFMALLLAPPLLMFLTPRVTRWGLRYEDIRASLRRQAILDRQSDKPSDAATQLTDDFPLLPGVQSLAPTPFVEIRSLTFAYPGSARPALDDVSLSVNRGESIAVMGRSGAGKSTLCYALNGLIPHFITGDWSGRVTVDAFDTRTREVWQQAGTVGLLFQEFEAQLVSTNIEMELAFPLEHVRDQCRRLSSEEMKGKIVRTLDLVGLSGLERRDPLSLSGGQRQRLVLASILIREPGLIALDEPLTDLDPDGRRTLEALLADLRRSGTAVIVAEHDPEEAAMADRLCVLDEGRVQWEGTPRGLFGHRHGQHLAKRWGVNPLPLAACFEELGIEELPVTVEEAWQLADQERVTVRPQTIDLQESVYPMFQSSFRGGASIVDVEKASYDYESGHTALTDVNLTIQDGEFIAILGQNGSGKSTLASLLNNLHRPTRGRIRVQGTDITNQPISQIAATVGYVFQNPDHQIFAETVEQEVLFGVRNLGISQEECDRRVVAALHAVGLDSPDIRHADPFSLSKGDRQRVAVASVLSARPRILIFDEPTTGLDARETERMMHVLKQLNREGHTIVMITHALPLVAAYAHRCVVMKKGEIYADGPTRSVFAKLSEPESAAATGLQPPQLTRFAARWGHTLLTVDEVKRALRKN